MRIIEEKNKITFVDFGGEGPVLHFAHANGYPPEVYRQFLAPFTKYFRVIGLYQRPLWPGSRPEKTKSWSQFAKDLIQFFEEQNIKEAIGMGHSLGGAVSLFAADECPELFKQLVFIDPVFLPLKFIFWQYFLPTSLRKKIIPPAKIALKRRDHWESKQAMFDSFRKKRVFKHLSNEILWDTVNYGTKPTSEGGITLRFPKEWEAQIYSLPPMVWGPLKRLKVPSIGLKAEFTDVILPDAWKKWQEYQPNATLLEFKKVGHLLPLEQPEALAQEIIKHLNP